jgi:hypothetical protein
MIFHIIMMQNEDNNSGYNPQKDTQNIFMLAGIGLIIKMFFGQDLSSDGETGPASAAAWGYGIVLVAAVVLLFINFGLLKDNGNINESMGFQTIKELFKDGTKPIIFIIVLLVWLFSMNITHYNNINEGKVANEYNLFSFASTFMLVLELGLLLKYLLKYLTARGRPSDDKIKVELEQLSSGMSVLFIINLIVLSAMQIILSYFSTDG